MNKSKEAWDYAQRIFPVKFIKAGKATLIMIFLVNVLDVIVGVPYREQIVITIEAVVLCGVFISVEHALKVRFKVGE